MSEGLKDVRQVTKDDLVLHIDQRERFLSEPVVRPESFGNAEYLQNLAKIYELVVENGGLYINNSQESSFSLVTENCGGKNYKGQVAVVKSKEGSFIGSFTLKGFDENSVLVDDITFSKTGNVIGNFKREDGADICFNGSFCGEFNHGVVDSLDIFTKKAMRTFQLFGMTDRTQKINPDFYRETPVERAEILENLRKTIKIEKKGRYITYRGKERYLSEFGGLEGMLRYVESLGENMKVVDVGVGKGIAWSELSEEYEKKLEFMATNLVYDQHLVDLFGKRVKFTPAEFMKGFENESVGGIVAMKSIAYSEDPELVATRLDEILVPGGIIKARFSSTENVRKVPDFRPYYRLTRQLLNLGYDVAISSDEMIVLAIKPGGKERAVDVFERDIESLKQNPS